MNKSVDNCMKFVYPKWVMAISGIKVWESDEASSWLVDLIRSSGIESRVEEQLCQGLGQSEELRAAVHLVEALGQRGV